MASIFIKNNEVLQYRYELQKLQILIPNEGKINIPVERLGDFSIENNYEDNFFPLFKIHFKVSSQVYYKILKYKNTCKIYLRIDKVNFNMVHSKSLYKEFINDTFDVISDEGTDDLNRMQREEENYKDYKSVVQDDTYDLTKINNDVSLYLFKNIDETRKNVNHVFQNINVADALTYVCGTFNSKMLLMTPPDNLTVYKEFLIPPLPALKALQFIDTYYGIYKKGTIFFIDYDCTYIIPYDGECTVSRKREPKCVTIIIPKSINASYNSQVGVVKDISDTSNAYIAANGNTVNIQNTSITNDFIGSNSIQTVDSYDGTTETSISDSVTKSSQSAIRIFEDTTKNPYLASMYTAQTNAMGVIVSVRLQNVDIGLLTPNKRFNLLFEDKNLSKKYTGSYLLVITRTDFFNEGRTNTADTTVVLKKTK